MGFSDFSAGGLRLGLRVYDYALALSPTTLDVYSVLSGSRLKASRRRAPPKAEKLWKISRKTLQSAYPNPKP